MGLDQEVVKEDIKRENDKIDSYEQQLGRLQEVDDGKREKWRGLPDPNEALRKRKEQLLGLILEQHKKLERYHQARRDAMKILGERKDKHSPQHELAQSGARRSRGWLSWISWL